MKFLLVAVNAKYIHSNPGIYSMSAYAIKNDSSLKEHIEIAEYTINHQMEDVIADIYFRKPQAIGISCYIWNISYVKEMIQEIKKLLPDTQIWLGGPEVSYDCENVLRENPSLTGIMVGEGEQTFLEVMQLYVSNNEREISHEQFLNIPGLALADDKQLGRVVYSPLRELTTLTEIPFLYEDLSKFENRIIYYESSRGCPFRCSYCLSSIDKTVRLRDLSVVKKELQFFLDSKVSQVKFVDRTFNCNKRHAMEIWQYLLMNDNGVTNFHFEVAADILDEEELSIINQFRPGAVQLEIGVQSTNRETIEEIDRRMDVEILRKIVARIQKGRNVHMHLDLIAGLPYEDYETFQKSFNDVYAMQPEQLQLGFLKVLKGSKMFEKSKDYGLVYQSRPPYEVLYTNWISYEQIYKLKQIEEMVELYYNSNQFVTTLRLCVPHFESAFSFFEQLAAYYERKGYFVQSPARGYRYQVLLAFLEEKNPAMRNLFAQALTMDVYLRENMKTRPDFALDLELFKTQSRAFFQQEAKDHTYLLDHYQQADARTLARMTHLEMFTYNFETLEEVAEPIYVLFDYATRNPLTGDAVTYYVMLP